MDNDMQHVIIFSSIVIFSVIFSFIACNMVTEVPKERFLYFILIAAVAGSLMYGARFLFYMDHNCIVGDYTENQLNGLYEEEDVEE